MKEVLTKKFWQSVKKTFEDAQLNEPPTAVKELSSEEGARLQAKADEPTSAAQTDAHAADTSKHSGIVLSTQ
jgi:hypothetical protein